MSLPGFVASLLDGFENQFDGLFVGRQLRCESAFIPNACVVALLVQNGLQCVEGFGCRSQTFTVARRAHRRNHELLKVHVAVGVASTVKHVEPWRRNQIGLLASQACIERQIVVCCGGPCNRERNTKNRVGSKPRLVRCAIEFA